MSIHYAGKMLDTYILDLPKIFYSSSVESDLKGEKSKLYILKYLFFRYFAFQAQ